MDKYLELQNGDRIHYLKFGKGKPLLLLPSMWLSSRSYSKLGKELGKYYMVYVLDLYKGKSVFKDTAKNYKDYCEELLLVIDKLNLKKYYLCGISLSGVIVNKFIHEYSPKPEKAFLISTTILPVQIQKQTFTLLKGYMMLFYHNFFSINGTLINIKWLADGLDFAGRHFMQALAEGEFASKVSLDHVAVMPVPTKLLYAKKDEYLPSGTFDDHLNVKNLDAETVNEYHTWFFGREAELAGKMHKFLH